MVVVGGRSGGSDGFYGNTCWFLVDDSVESVFRIGGVFNDSAGSVSLDKGVAALNGVSVSGLLLLLIITGQRILDVVRVAVLRVRVIVSIDGLRSIGNRGCSCLCVNWGWCSVVRDRCRNHASRRSSDKAEEEDELVNKMIRY